jgi:tetratricopeptide (TPR) repeat protein
MIDAPTTPDPIEIAMEAEAHDRSADSPARTLLKNQNRLVLWQIASERAGFALKVMIGVACLAAAAALAGMAWTASRAEGVVVEAFSTPPSLAAQGLTGAVVAGEVLDRLSALDRQTHGTEALQLSDAWTVGARVAIPETGVSIDELDRMLRRWLGHEAIVTGAVTETPGAIMLSARTSRGNLVHAEGPVTALPSLAANVAEQLLAQAQPVRYGRLMLDRHRSDEAERILSAVAQTTLSRTERADAYSSLGGAYLTSERLPQAAAATREAMALRPTSTAAMLGAWAEHAQGHAAAAEALFRAGIADTGRIGSPSPWQRRRQTAFNAAHHALEIGDFGLAGRNFGEVVQERFFSNGFDRGHYQDHIRALIGLHETGAARRELPFVVPALGDNPRSQSFRMGLADNLAAAEQDWPALLTALDEGRPSRSMTAAPPEMLRAQALAHLGRMAEAGQLAATLPTDCDRCLRVRAEVAELAGDRAGAERWLAEAVRLAPNIPFAETDWARILLARGDVDGALAKARSAHARSPRFADPLEVWGEALLAKGDAHGAAAKFVQAAALAPRWGRLRLKAGEALAALGDGPRAQAQWRWAAGMDLTPAERAELNSLPAWGGTGGAAAGVGKSDPSATAAIGVTPPHPALLRRAR